MAGRPNSTAARGVPRNRRVKPPTSSYGERRATKAEKLVEIIDQCTLAKEAANEIGNTFLAYLLDMTILEARSAIRPMPPALAPADKNANQTPT